MLFRLFTAKPTSSVFTDTGSIVVRRCQTTISASAAATTKQQAQQSCRRRFSESSTATTTTATTATTKATIPPPPPKSATAAAEAFESSDSVPIGASLMAAVAAIGAVSATAFAVENSTKDSCLPYSTQKGAQRFSQDTFTGRFARIFLACDPCLLFYTQAQIDDAKQVLLLNASNTGTGTGTDGKYKSSDVSDRTLWESRRIVDAAVHPDTNEMIPRPFRMSGYVPYNGPICVAMVASTSTVPLLFWSWINQSQNALVNYYNRNASSPMTNETLVKSYTAAVGSALVVAFGLSTFVQKRFTPQKAKQMMKYVAFPSAVVASSLNCYVVRSPEITTGIPLMDEYGQEIMVNENNNEIENKSQLAAKCGVESTTLSRALLQAPVYFIPSMLMGTLPPLRDLIEKNPRYRVPITTFLVLIAFGVGLPATVAVFPQISSIASTDVEPKYQKLMNPETAKPYTVFYYNKGL